MHILTLVYFKASHGGLHENVITSINASLSAGHKCTVVAKRGQFLEKALELGANVISVDFEKASYYKTIQQIKKLNELSRIDIIHSHPFASRDLGALVSKLLGLPIVTTVHGRYLDGIPENSRDYEKIITVSDGIGDYLIENGLLEPEKLYTSPNTPNNFIFFPKESFSNDEKSKVTVALVSRLDRDKQFVLDTFIKAVEHASRIYPEKVHWIIVGQGDQEASLKDNMCKSSGTNSFEFLGWLEGDALRRAYTSSDIAIVPGRCALEAMSCGVVSIGLGSKGYTGIIGPRNWQKGVYSNFGGLGNMQESYEIGAVEKDFDKLMHSKETRTQLGEFGLKLVKAFFDQKKVNEELLSLYDIVWQESKVQTKPIRQESEFLALQIDSINASNKSNNQVLLKVISTGQQKLQFAWYVSFEGEVIEKHLYTDSNEITISLSSLGNYRFYCYLKNEAGEKLSFIHSTCVFDTNGVQELVTNFIEPEITTSERLKVGKKLERAAVLQKLNFNL